MYPRSEVLLQLTGAGRTARDVLALLIDTPGQELHTREIARRVSADPHPVHRALAHLLAAGVIQSRPLGNLRLWSVREDSPLVPPMRDLIRQTSGVAARLRTALGPMKGLQFAFLFGSYAAGRDERDSDIDLFLVGAVDWRRLSLIATQLAADLGRDIEPVVWTLEELGEPNAARRRFLRNLLGRPRIWLLGDDHELERVRRSLGAGMVTSDRSRATRPGRRRAPARPGGNERSARQARTRGR